ncbi:hypothetical protein P152DRAFT_445998 [Eremomyces bilateralis CBS 781.70]|uniref:H-type lectin domain-containing protein n=1 Tax=Eremomyces bilateralis CBS 781.70 TaxID=1392243 RepID=A0A6G1GEN5_9PEZI|nr:uncharacterized protein P152DRAFT_445998 [Eremomyces bilateralis CBS 781.70]KAF1816330.1 hypothetical protein P152DRAFT_445998 [Eremomyces bilateralis CBS 781.70]
MSSSASALESGLHDLSAPFYTPPSSPKPASQSSKSTPTSLHHPDPQPSTGHFTTISVRPATLPIRSTSRTILFPTCHYNRPPKIAAGFSMLNLAAYPPSPSTSLEDSPQTPSTANDASLPLRANLVGSEITAASMRLTAETWGRGAMYAAAGTWIEHKDGAKQCWFGQFDSRQVKKRRWRRRGEKNTGNQALVSHGEGRQLLTPPRTPVSPSVRPVAGREHTERCPTCGQPAPKRVVERGWADQSTESRPTTPLPNSRAAPTRMETSTTMASSISTSSTAPSTLSTTLSDLTVSDSTATGMNSLDGSPLSPREPRLRQPRRNVYEKWVKLPFPQPEGRPPEIICWLNRVNFPARRRSERRPRRLFAKVEGVESSHFRAVLDASGLDDRTDRGGMDHNPSFDDESPVGASMCWIGYPHGKKCVDSGVIEATFGLDEQEDDEYDQLVRVDFKDGWFTKPPTVLAALSGFDADRDGDLRVRVEVQWVDTEGFICRLGSWGGGRLKECWASWVALGS